VKKLAWGFFFTSILFTSAAFPRPSLTRAQFDELTMKQRILVEIDELPKTDEEVSRLGLGGRRSLKAATKRILDAPDGSLTFDDLVEFDRALHQYGSVQSRLTVASYLAEGMPVGKAAARQIAKLSKDYHSISLDAQLYLKLNAFEQGATLNGEQKRLVDVLTSLFVFDSLQTQAVVDSWEIRGLLDELSKSEVKFAEGLQKEATFHRTAEQLNGLSDSFLESLVFDGKNYTLDGGEWWQMDQVLRFCTDPDTRDLAWRASHNIADSRNRALVDLITAGRARIAKRMGHPSWANYSAVGLSTTPRSLLAQFRVLREKTERAFQKERREIEALIGKTPAISDIAYARRLKLEQIGLDELAVREYFPADKVVEGLFQYAENIFGLEIHAIKEPAWEGSELYALLDKKSGAVLGAFALDLFPRDGKNGGFHQLAITGGVLLKNGLTQKPFVYVHTNFTPATEAAPSLLSHEEVWTLFHEFGHALHSLLSAHQYCSLGPEGNNTDLVEVPSTFFEKLAWEPAVLRQFARHWKTGAPIPEPMLAKIHRSRQIFPAHTLRQSVVASALDLKLHGASPRPVEEVEQAVYQAFYYPLPEGVVVTASNGHFTGYEGNYWSYLWAEAISAVRLDRMLKTPAGAYDMAEWAEFRRLFMAVGGTKDSEEIVRNLVGKKFSLCSALLSHYGLPVR
jgi:Zn-dependent oligopeptidase